MRIKTFIEATALDIDKAVNSFESQHKVRATQTHVVVVNDKLTFVATVFFEDK